MKRKGPIFLLILCVIAAAIAGVLLARAYHRRTVLPELPEETYVPLNTIEVDGTRYRKKTGLKTTLFLGVDSTFTDMTTEGYADGGRTDTLILMIQEGDSMTLLEISRDTMTEVDVYDGDGNLLNRTQMQINMQYAYGDSPRRSAYLTRRTVSELLYDVATA